MGKPAPPIEAKYWINEPADTHISYAGKVTLVEFTAHWCIPCKETYPSLMNLSRKFGARGVQIVLATSLYGYFGKERDLSPEQELLTDRKYFVEENKLTLPVAIAAKSSEDLNSQHYGVQAIPEIVVIDRHGIVRRFLMGVTPSDEAALAAMLEDLLSQ